MTALLFVAGLVCLIVGAELLVRGASRLALAVGISPLVIGLTIVAVGTSSPEVAVSIGAAMDGQTDIAVGNVVGSNIFNVLFILGLSAMIAPLVVNEQIVRQEVPIMIGVSLLLLALGLDGSLGIADAVILVSLLVAYTVFLIVQSRRIPASTTVSEQDVTRPRRWHDHVTFQLVLIAAGLALLVLGSDWLVTSATVFAVALGVSDLVIGLTIVAAGTSMPELATSVMAALRKERDIAIGNVVGSNTFNILGCLGLTGLIAPGGVEIAAPLLRFDIWIMIAVAFACLPVFLSGRCIARWEGALFLLYYVAYTAYIVLATQHHAALGGFSKAMLGFVLPLTIVTLVVTSMRPADPDGRT